jgi:polyhydroxyalkanoate synthase subunit PhaC
MPKTSRRYLALWEEFLTAVLADPVAAGLDWWGLPGTATCDELSPSGPAAGATPIPAHLTSAAGLWLSSRAAFPFLKSVSLTSNAPAANATASRLRALAAEIDACGLEPIAAALDGEIGRRAAAYAAGLKSYRRHPYRRAAYPAPVVWHEGGTRLLDYGRDPAAPAVLIVPSLINRYYVLDLLPERSFVPHLAGHGLRPLVVDWGSPGGAGIGLDVAGCVDRLDRALAVAAPPGASPAAVLGYCMGGLLALAVALRPCRPVGALALLVTPWDFHAERPTQARLLGLLGERLAAAAITTLPVDFVQTLFSWLDPFLAQRKFARFAALDPQGAEARGFVALEDWINDGSPLPIAVARECLVSWYGENAPAQGKWRLTDRAVRPQRLRAPALVVVPGRDRIVPPASAMALAAAIPGAEIMRPPLGHIGMMSAARAPELLWTPPAVRLSALLATE